MNEPIVKDDYGLERLLSSYGPFRTQKHLFVNQKKSRIKPSTASTAATTWIRPSTTSSVNRAVICRDIRDCSFEPNFTFSNNLFSRPVSQAISSRNDYQYPLTPSIQQNHNRIPEFPSGHFESSIPIQGQSSWKKTVFESPLRPLPGAIAHPSLPTIRNSSRPMSKAEKIKIERLHKNLDSISSGALTKDELQRLHRYLSESMEVAHGVVDFDLTSKPNKNISSGNEQFSYNHSGQSPISGDKSFHLNDTSCYHILPIDQLLTLVSSWGRFWFHLLESVTVTHRRIVLREVISCKSSAEVFTALSKLKTFKSLEKSEGQLVNGVAAFNVDEQFTMADFEASMLQKKKANDERQDDDSRHDAIGSIHSLSRSCSDAESALSDSPVLFDNALSDNFQAQNNTSDLNIGNGSAAHQFEVFNCNAVETKSKPYSGSTSNQQYSLSFNSNYIYNENQYVPENYINFNLNNGCSTPQSHDHQQDYIDNHVLSTFRRTNSHFPTANTQNKILSQTLSYYQPTSAVLESEIQFNAKNDKEVPESFDMELPIVEFDVLSRSSAENTVDILTQTELTATNSILSGHSTNIERLRSATSSIRFKRAERLRNLKKQAKSNFKSQIPLSMNNVQSFEEKKLTDKLINHIDEKAEIKKLMTWIASLTQNKNIKLPPNQENVANGVQNSQNTLNTVLELVFNSSGTDFIEDASEAKNDYMYKTNDINLMSNSPFQKQQRMREVLRAAFSLSSQCKGVDDSINRVSQIHSQSSIDGWITEAFGQYEAKSKIRFSQKTLERQPKLLLATNNQDNTILDDPLEHYRQSQLLQKGSKRTKKAFISFSSAKISFSNAMLELAKLQIARAEMFAVLCRSVEPRFLDATFAQKWVLRIRTSSAIQSFIENIGDKKLQKLFFNLDEVCKENMKASSVGIAQDVALDTAAELLERFLALFNRKLPGTQNLVTKELSEWKELSVSFKRENNARYQANQKLQGLNSTLTSKNLNDTLNSVKSSNVLMGQDADPKELDVENHHNYLDNEPENSSSGEDDELEVYLMKDSNSNAFTSSQRQQIFELERKLRRRRIRATALASLPALLSSVSALLSRCDSNEESFQLLARTSEEIEEEINSVLATQVEFTINNHLIGTYQKQVNSLHDFQRRLYKSYLVSPSVSPEVKFEIAKRAAILFLPDDEKRRIAAMHIEDSASSSLLHVFDEKRNDKLTDSLSRVGKLKILAERNKKSRSAVFGNKTAAEIRKERALKEAEAKKIQLEQESIKKTRLNMLHSLNLPPDFSDEFTPEQLDALSKAEKLEKLMDLVVSRLHHDSSVFSSERKSRKHQGNDEDIDEVVEDENIVDRSMNPTLWRFQTLMIIIKRQYARIQGLRMEDVTACSIHDNELLQYIPLLIRLIDEEEELSMVDNSASSKLSISDAPSNLSFFRIRQYFGGLNDEAQEAADDRMKFLILRKRRQRVREYSKLYEQAAIIYSNYESLWREINSIETPIEVPLTTQEKIAKLKENERRKEEIEATNKYFETFFIDIQKIIDDLIIQRSLYSRFFSQNSEMESFLDARRNSITKMIELPIKESNLWQFDPLSMQVFVIDCPFTPKVKALLSISNYLLRNIETSARVARHFHHKTVIPSKLASQSYPSYEISLDLRLAMNELSRCASKTAALYMENRNQRKEFQELDISSGAPFGFSEGNGLQLRIEIGNLEALVSAISSMAVLFFGRFISGQRLNSYFTRNSSSSIAKELPILNLMNAFSSFDISSLPGNNNKNKKKKAASLRRSSIASDESLTVTSGVVTPTSKTIQSEKAVLHSPKAAQNENRNPISVLLAALSNYPMFQLVSNVDMQVQEFDTTVSRYLVNISSKDGENLKSKSIGFDEVDSICSRIDELRAKKDALYKEIFASQAKIQSVIDSTCAMSGAVIIDHSNFNSSARPAVSVNTSQSAGEMNNDMLSIKWIRLSSPTIKPKQSLTSGGSLHGTELPFSKSPRRNTTERDLIDHAFTHAWIVSANFLLSARKRFEALSQELSDLKTGNKNDNLGDVNKKNRGNSKLNRGRLGSPKYSPAHGHSATSAIAISTRSKLQDAKKLNTRFQYKLRQVINSLRNCFTRKRFSAFELAVAMFAFLKVCKLDHITDLQAIAMRNVPSYETSRVNSLKNQNVLTNHQQEIIRLRKLISEVDNLISFWEKRRRIQKEALEVLSNYKLASKLSSPAEELFNGDIIQNESPKRFNYDTQKVSQSAQEFFNNLIDKKQIFSPKNDKFDAQPSGASGSSPVQQKSLFSPSNVQSERGHNPSHKKNNASSINNFNANKETPLSNALQFSKFSQQANEFNNLLNIQSKASQDVNNSPNNVTPINYFGLVPQQTQSQPVTIQESPEILRSRAEQWCRTSKSHADHLISSLLDPLLPIESKSTTLDSFRRFIHSYPLGCKERRTIPYRVVTELENALDSALTLSKNFVENRKVKATSDSLISYGNTTPQQKQSNVDSLKKDTLMNAYSMVKDCSLKPIEAVLSAISSHYFGLNYLSSATHNNQIIKKLTHVNEQPQNNNNQSSTQNNDLPQVKSVIAKRNFDRDIDSKKIRNSDEQRTKDLDNPDGLNVKNLKTHKFDSSISNQFTFNSHPSFQKSNEASSRYSDSYSVPSSPLLQDSQRRIRLQSLSLNTSKQEEGAPLSQFFLSDFGNNAEVQETNSAPYNPQELNLNGITSRGWSSQSKRISRRNKQTSSNSKIMDTDTSKIPFKVKQAEPKQKFASSLFDILTDENHVGHQFNIIEANSTMKSDHAKSHSRDRFRGHVALPSTALENPFSESNLQSSSVAHAATTILNNSYSRMMKKSTDYNNMVSPSSISQRLKKIANDRLDTSLRQKRLLYGLNGPHNHLKHQHHFGSQLSNGSKSDIDSAVDSNISPSHTLNSTLLQQFKSNSNSSNHKLRHHHNSVDFNFQFDFGADNNFISEKPMNNIFHMEDEIFEDDVLSREIINESNDHYLGISAREEDTYLINTDQLDDDPEKELCNTSVSMSSSKNSSSPENSNIDHVDELSKSEDASFSQINQNKRVSFNFSSANPIIEIDDADLMKMPKSYEHFAIDSSDYFTPVSKSKSMSKQELYSYNTSSDFKETDLFTKNNPTNERENNISQSHLAQMDAHSAINYILTEVLQQREDLRKSLLCMLKITSHKSSTVEAWRSQTLKSIGETDGLLSSLEVVCKTSISALKLSNPSNDTVLKSLRGKKISLLNNTFDNLANKRKIITAAAKQNEDTTQYAPHILPPFWPTHIRDVMSEQLRFATIFAATRNTFRKSGIEQSTRFFQQNSDLSSRSLPRGAWQKNTQKFQGSLDASLNSGHSIDSHKNMLCPTDTHNDGLKMKPSNSIVTFEGLLKPSGAISILKQRIIDRLNYSKDVEFIQKVKKKSQRQIMKKIEKLLSQVGPAASIALATGFRRSAWVLTNEVLSKWLESIELRYQLPAVFHSASNEKLTFATTSAVVESLGTSFKEMTKIVAVTENNI